MPQTRWEQRSPGSVHVPQLALQQTLPGAHCVVPHATPCGVAEAVGAADVAGGADALAVTAAFVSIEPLPDAPVSNARAPASSTSMGGST
jgi:hypothetical protein